MGDEEYILSNNKLWRPRFDIIARVKVSTEELYKIGCKSNQNILTQLWEEKNGTFWLRVYDAIKQSHIGDIKLENL